MELWDDLTLVLDNGVIHIPAQTRTFIWSKLDISVVSALSLGNFESRLPVIYCIYTLTTIIPQNES